MNRLHFSLLALAASTFLTSPATAATLTPTLDNLKSEASTLSGNYILTELIGELPESAVKVMIGEQDYYFTPSSEDNAGLLTTLAGTSAGNLIESVDGMFDLNGKKYTFNAAAIPNSAFSYSEGSDQDYNFILSEADAEGNITNKYYTINLKPEAFTTSENISWSPVGEDKKDDKDTDLSDGRISGVVEVQLPNEQTKYFEYTYTKPDGRTVYDTRQGNILTGDVNADFIGSSSTFGGGIYSRRTIGNITGDFINNTASKEGGAIYNDYNGGIIGDITGDFIGNYAGVGVGAILTRGLSAILLEILSVTILVVMPGLF